MGNWLSGRTESLSLSLTFAAHSTSNMASILDNMKKRFTESDDTYYQTAQNLADPSTFQGQGAQAFLQAVDADTNTTRVLADGLEHVATASDTLGKAIQQSSSTYDHSLSTIYQDPNVPSSYLEKWHDALINTLFDDANPGYISDTLSEILKNGWWGALTDPWNTAFATVQATVIQDAKNYATQQINGNFQIGADQWIIDHTPWLAGKLGNPTQAQLQTQKNQIQQQTLNDFTNALNGMSRDITLILQEWAGELQGEYQTFQTAIQNPNGPLNARDIYDLIYYGSMDGSYKDGTQSTNSPITITPYTTKDGKKGLLITLGGTDLGHLTNDDSLLGALETGSGLPTAYAVEIHNALETYMNEHPDAKGSELTISGYSLGGMQAQLFASDLAQGYYGDLTGADGLHVANVVTYGSPVMGPPMRGVNYTMYDATNDPIILLSHAENKDITDLKSILVLFNSDPVTAAQQLQAQGGKVYQLYLSLIRADQLPWDQKVNQYIDPTTLDPNHQYHIIPITDVGGTSIETGDPHFYNANPLAKIPEIGRPIAGLIPIPGFDPGHQLNFNNHLQYYKSSQLDNSLPGGTNINPSSLGPTEYFPVVSQ